MKQQLKTKLLIFLFLISMVIVKTGVGQIVPPSTVTTLPNNNSFQSGIVLNNSEQWFKFTTDSIHVSVKVKLEEQGVINSLSKVELFKDAGGGLIQIVFTDTLRTDSTMWVSATFLNPTTDIYVRVSSITQPCATCSGSSYPKISMDVMALQAGCNTYVQPPCQYVKDTSFEYATLPCASIPNPNNGACWNDPYVGFANCFWNMPLANSFVNCGGLGSLASLGTSDYYCTGGHTGSGCAGIFLYTQTNPTPTTYGERNYREYITETLFTPLTTGKTYSLTIWVKRNPAKSFATSNIEVALSNGIYTQNSFNAIVSPAGQIIPMTSSIITSTNWTKLTTVFAASGNYSQITIGNFTGVGSSIVANVTPSVNITQDRAAYYFVDDVSILETFTTSVTNPVCLGLGTATINVIPSNAGTSYTWTSSPLTPTLITVSGSSVVVSPTVTTNYTVFTTNTLGCIMSNTVDVLTTPITFTATSYTFCPGAPLSITVTATGLTTYTWVPNPTITGSLNSPTITVSPTTTTTYTVFGNLTGCPNTYSSTVTITDISPTIGISTSSIVCVGSMVTVTTTPTYSITYLDFESGLYISTPNPYTYSTVGNYTIDVGSEDPVSGCTSYSFFPISVVPALNPTLTISPSQTICAGQTTTLNVSGATTYTWSTSANANSIVVSPTVTTTYTVTGETACGTATTQVTVYIAPPPTISVNNATICSGQSATLTASGGNTYVWSTGASTSNIAVSPTSLTQYTVTGTTSAGCTNSAVATVSVNANPNFIFLPSTNSTTICAATSFTIKTLPVSLQYTWSTGATNTNSIIVNPSSTTIYTATGTNTNTGCSFSKTFTVNILPITPVAVSSTTICRNSTATLTASNSTTSYTWSTGPTGTNTIFVAPLSTTNYTVTGTTACGTSSAIATVTVYALPFIAAIGGANNVCAGTNATMTAVPNNSALTYVWSNGYTGNPNIVTVTTNTIFTVVATNSLGCSSTASKTITLLPSPTLSLSANLYTICSANGSTTLTASGATNYTWSPSGSLNSSTGSSVIAHPNTTTVYTVTGSVGSCTSTKTISIHVTPTPTLSISATSTNVCIGSATLTASGATSYSWSTGVTTASTVVTPTINTTYYTVYGYNGNNCSSSQSIPVLVSFPPQISVVASPSIICAGSSSTLTATSSATSYTWLPGPSSANPYFVTPATSTIYTVTGRDGSCTRTKTISVTVIPNPTISISASSPSICLGNSTTLTANGATSYTWLPAGSLNTNTGSVVVASPTVATIYTVTGQVGSCISTKTIVIGIHPSPTVTVNSPTICVGATATLTANGANSYSWSTGQNTNPITVSPTVTTIFTVTGTNAAGCSTSVTSTVTVSTGVIPTFAIIAPNNGNICASGTGSNTPFSTNIPNPSNYTYLWSPGNSTSATPNINITQPISVKVTVTDAICGVSSVQDICVNYVASICCSNTITTLTNTVITDVAQLPNSTYKVSGTLTFNIPNTFQSGLSYKEFLMSTGSKIIVTPTTSLNLHVCKLYSCEGMWEGIELQSNATSAAAIDINDGTTIEDAYTAISADNNNVNVSNKILVNVATFNKNYIDINIKNWTSPSNTYDFESRTGNYISQSSTTSPGGNLKCSQYYTPTIRARSYAGIDAISSTSVNVGHTASTNTFFINSFSNKDYGIIFEKTSGMVTNAKFNNMAGGNGSCPLIGCTPPLPTGIGIVATTNLVTPTTVSVTSTPAPVTFTNVECAVYARRVTNLYVLNTVIENPNQSNWNLITTGNGNGYNGIFTEDIKRELHVNYNTIKNAMFGVQATYVNASNVAILSISNNTILTTANNFTTATAINVSSAIGFIGSPSTMPIAANIITNTRNGIQLTGLTGGVTVSGNTINMKTGNTANTTGSAIYLAGGNTNCSIDNNDIFGNSNGLVQNYQLNKIGINVKSSLNCYVQCNRMEKLGTAVRYDGICTSPQTGFFNNGLNAPIRRGLELRNSASMGTQGVYTGIPPAHTVVSTSENQWNGGWNTANTDQTYVFDAGSNALGSILCVSGGVELPTDNQWNSGFPSPATLLDAYSIGNLNLLTSSTAPPVLSNCPNKLLVGLKTAAQNDSIATAERDEEYKRIITQNLTDPTITNESKWQLKDFMYRNLANGSAPMDATVQSFYSAEQTGSVNDNRTIDSLILLGDYTQASSINGSVSAALIIEQTAKDYNSLWLQKFSDPDYIATSADILALNDIANQCIHKGGKSVAHARALLGAIYNHPSDYDDDCMDDKMGSRLNQNASHFETKGNTINLFPNPNNGNFTLSYYLTKEVTEADVIVEDITGKLIYQSNIDVTMDNMSLHLMDAKTGIYFVKVMNGKEIISVNKVIITK